MHNNSITRKNESVIWFQAPPFQFSPQKTTEQWLLLVPLLLSQCPLTHKLMFFSQKLRNTAVTLVRQVGKSQLFILFSLFCIVGAIIVCVSLLLYYLLLLNWLLLWLMMHGISFYFLVTTRNTRHTLKLSCAEMITGCTPPTVP